MSVKRPVHPRKGMATVAKYSSAPGSHGLKRKPTAAWKQHQRLLNLKYKADRKKYYEDLRKWKDSMNGVN